MTEPNTAETAPEAAPTEMPDTGSPAETVDWKAEAEKYKALSRKHEERAKANASAVSELDKVRKAQMTETEKAVAEAEARGRTAAQQATAERLARAELRAAAAGRVEKDALDGFLEFANLQKFIGEDGEPDEKAIESAIKKLAGPQRAPNFDGGARTPAGKTTDMNTLIRQKAGLG